MAAPLRFKTDIADYAGNAWVSYKIYIRLIPKTKDAVLIQATQSIFAPRISAFSTGNPETISSPTILEIIRGVGSSAKS
jgi:hypothetical protein